MEDDSDLSDDLPSLDIPRESVNTKTQKKAKTNVRSRRRSDGTSYDIQKSSKAVEREAKKQKLAQDKLAKQTANEMNKVYKPGECMKYMNVEIHNTLAKEWYMSDLMRELSAAGAHLQVNNDFCDQGLVMWTRTLPRKIDATSGNLCLTPSKENISRALYIKSCEDISEYVLSNTLSPHITQIQALANCQVTLVLFGVKDYFKCSGRKTKNSIQKRFNEIQLEMAITDVLVSCECDTVRVHTPNELALLIVQFTKAIAEEPHKRAKRACEEQAEFYMQGDNKKCVAVDKHGNGVRGLWQQMLAVLPLSSLETSRALCANYETPLALYQVFQSADGVKEVADVGVSRAAVPGSKARRVGPEFSRKLQTLFTADDGEVLLE